MKPPPRNFSRDFRPRFLDLLWAQWSALGIAASSRTEIPGCIDIEALILITTSQGRYDARLFDEALDWLSVNGSWVNVQRLRNLQHSLELGNRRVLGAVAELLSRRAVHAKWKPLAMLEPAGIPSAPQPLFLRDDGRDSPVFGEADSVFIRWGFWRGPCQLRQLSHAPNPWPASNLLYKLRALFGIQARCEVVLWLLANQRGRPAAIARALCYFPKTIEDTLKELAASGLVREARVGRERHYALDPADWKFLRTWTEPRGFPEWIDWSRRFATLERILAVLAQPDLSEMMLASELRRTVEDLQPILTEGRLLQNFAANRQHSGLQFIEAVVSDLRSLLSPGPPSRPRIATKRRPA